MSTAAFNIHPKVIKCKICSKESLVIDINVTKHEELNGCNIIKCNKCHSVWYICRINNNRFSISNKSKMVKHFTLLHSQPEIKKTNSLCSQKELNNLNNVDLESHVSNENIFCCSTTLTIPFVTHYTVWY